MVKNYYYNKKSKGVLNMNIEELLLNPKEEKIKELNSLIKARELELRYIEDLICSSNDSELLYLCGKHIEWINKGRIAHALSKTLDDYYIFEYAYYIQKKPDIREEIKHRVLKELEKGMLRSKGSINVYYYAREIFNAPIERLALTLAKSNDSRSMVYYLRDFGSELSPETKIILAKRIIALKNSLDIILTSEMIDGVSVREYAEGLLNSKPTEHYGAHLSTFLNAHELESDLQKSTIEALIKTSDYFRIINLIKNTESDLHMKLIDHILQEENNYENPDFWLSYIIPLAISNKPCANYAVAKIIESNNVEIITITIYYLEDLELKIRLEEALNQIPNLDQKYQSTALKETVISKVRKKYKEF